MYYALLILMLCVVVGTDYIYMISECNQSEDFMLNKRMDAIYSFERKKKVCFYDDLHI